VVFGADFAHALRTWDDRGAIRRRIHVRRIPQLKGLFSDTAGYLCATPTFRLLHNRGEGAQTYEDQGISGAKGRDQRPAFNAMLKDAVRGDSTS
jgi:hypothetical protein